VTGGRDEVLLVRGSLHNEVLQEVKPDESELIPTKLPIPIGKKKKLARSEGERVLGANRASK
jgi:hypothetical protein